MDSGDGDEPGDGSGGGTDGLDCGRPDDSGEADDTGEADDSGEADDTSEADDGSERRYAVGDRFDCPGCGDSHAVQRGSGLSVGGAPADVDRSLYVRCPTAGVVPLPDGREPPAEAFTDDGDGEDWP